jgi:replication factor C subunit 1
VTSAVSGKTSYVVVGTDAGEKKMQTIEKLKVKTLDEDGFLNLIATRYASFMSLGYGDLV